MRIAAYCDFYGEARRPLQLIIQARPGELNWSKTLYIPVSGPFEPFEAEDFGDLPGVSVLLEDLVRHIFKVEYQFKDGYVPEIGILLPKLAERHGTNIQLLVLQMNDIEEVLDWKRDGSRRNRSL